MEDTNKPTVCDSCGNGGELTPTPHAQANNPKVWFYCTMCKFAHDKEVEVNKRLKALANTFNPSDPNSKNPNDPAVAAQLHQQVAEEIANKAD